VFDIHTGVRLGASQAFGASELVQAWMRSGQQVYYRHAVVPAPVTRVAGTVSTA